METTEDLPSQSLTSDLRTLLPQALTSALCEADGTCIHKLGEIVMNRIITLFFLLTMLLSGFGTTLSASAEGAKGGMSCQSVCSSCAAKCEKTLAYCKKKGGKHVEKAHLTAIQDCIATCKLSDDFMKRGSAMMSKACELCKEACLKCAEACETFKGDKTMKDCADECRKCAASCEKMSS
jgi:hypothetical protein